MICSIFEKDGALDYVVQLPYLPTLVEEFVWRLPPAAPHTKLGVGFEKLPHVEGLRVIEICSNGRAHTAQTARDGTVDERLRPPRKLQGGDFVVMVNGRSSRSEILEELRSGRLVTAIVWRFPQPLQLEQPRGWEGCQTQEEAADDKDSESRTAP
ncbi:unnamed protein product [Symbiodinium natans]|uniref:Uncharacterized protein n=1 Tax=Symbiodinium natans TaxID=878477 RepID=A0A812UJJ5_9DINO|nr:unnamed protein product [Symbiodinium natans]